MKVVDHIKKAAGETLFSFEILPPLKGQNIHNQEKIDALNAYSDELRDFPHPRSKDAIEAISKRWGSVSGYKNAEAFYLIRELTD